MKDTMKFKENIFLLYASHTFEIKKKTCCRYPQTHPFVEKSDVYNEFMYIFYNIHHSIQCRKSFKSHTMTYITIKLQIKNMHEIIV